MKEQYKNKAAYICKLRQFLRKQNNCFVFPKNTMIGAYYYEEYKNHELVSLELKASSGNIILISNVDGIRETDNLAEFTFSEIKKIANIVIND